MFINVLSCHWFPCEYSHAPCSSFIKLQSTSSCWKRHINSWSSCLQQEEGGSREEKEAHFWEAQEELPHPTGPDDGERQQASHQLVSDALAWATNLSARVAWALHTACSVFPSPAFCCHLDVPLFSLFFWFVLPSNWCTASFKFLDILSC